MQSRHAIDRRTFIFLEGFRLTRYHEVDLLALSLSCRAGRAGQDSDPRCFQLQDICNPPTEVISGQKEMKHQLCSRTLNN